MIRLCLISALMLGVTSSVAAERLTGKVVKVADGDTITVLNDRQQQVRVRFAGIDCPERGQPWGRNATQALKAILTGAPVTIEVMDVDRYGRTVGRVFIGGVNVNRRLVAQGDCWVYPRYANDEQLFKLQRQAQAANLGLWQLPKRERMPPWQWRKQSSH